MHQHCKETKCGIFFDENKATIYYPDGAEATAKQENGLYPLAMRVGTSHAAAPAPPEQQQQPGRLSARVVRETTGDGEAAGKS